MRQRVILLSAAAVCVSSGWVWAKGPDISLRPVERYVAPVISNDPPAASLSFEEWVAQFRDRALVAGITPETLDRAFADLTYDAYIIERDRNQAEFTKTIWDYLDTAASDLRIQNGRLALRKWEQALTEIEAQFGVEKEIVVAIWGLESAYGSFRGDSRVISGLATLAYDGRRARFFEQELMQALRILQSGDTTVDRMQGSWAGAMGHTQFMPSSYQAHAVDFNGDGKRDIWDDDPRDALASTAAYLGHYGWTTGQVWGEEVRLGEGFDYTLADRKITRLPSDWNDIGVIPVSGVLDDTRGPASILLPGGAEGAAFMIYSNFRVLERYNSADAYVIGVGHLADRIGGGGKIEQSWPRRLRALTKDEREELQERLSRAGYGQLDIDAKMGPLTIGAVRAFQKAMGLPADGFPSLDVLERLRAL